MLEDTGIEHVAPDHGQVGTCILRAGFLHDAFQLGNAALGFFRINDAVLVSLVMRHFLDTEDTALTIAEHRQHLAQHTVLTGIDQVISEDHGKWLVTDHRFCTQHGMTPAQRLGLAYIGAGHVRRQDFAHDLQQFGLALLLQLRFQLVVLVEVVLDRALAAAGDKHQFLDAGVDSLFRCILDQRLVDHRQHFLGIRLGRRQESGPQTRDREDRLAYFLFHILDT